MVNKNRKITEPPSEFSGGGFFMVQSSKTGERGREAGKRIWKETKREHEKTKEQQGAADWNALWKACGMNTANDSVSFVAMIRYSL